MKIVHHHANGCFDWLISGHQSVNPSREAFSILSGKYKRFTFVHPVVRLKPGFHIVVVVVRAWLNGNTMCYETFICFYVSEANPLYFGLCSQMFDDVYDVEYTTFKMFVTQMSNCLFVISFQLMF